MRRLRLASALLCLAVAACAGPRPDGAPLAFSDSSGGPATLRAPPDGVTPPSFSGGLAGRTISVGSVADIRLGPKEVVLTFDDGPMPGKTQAVLDTLDRFGVKATFLMVGQMARAYPELVRQVAARGHTIGSHTENHENLRSVGHGRAVAQIEQGRRSISAALGPSSRRAAPFFRFPYLADTPALREHLAANGIVVIDSDVDSKDYFVSSPDQLRERALARVAARGSGIILMHDIHHRTVSMLPGFLADLKARGFKVVNLVPGPSRRDGLLLSALD